MPEVKSRSSPKGKKLRKLRKYLFHYILLAAFCLAIVFVMCYTVFFKLDKIQVTGCSVYSEQQIIDEIGAEEGESLFRINISNAEKTLRGKLPYIRSVKISRQFPTTLKVEIEEEEVLGAVYTLEGFTLLSTTGKVLETGVLALPESTPRIVGLPTGLVYSTGSYLREEVGSEALMEELQALKIVYEEHPTKARFPAQQTADRLGRKKCQQQAGKKQDRDELRQDTREHMNGLFQGQPGFAPVPEERGKQKKQCRRVKRADKNGVQFCRAPLSIAFLSGARSGSASKPPRTAVTSCGAENIWAMAAACAAVKPEKSGRASFTTPRYSTRDLAAAARARAVIWGA